jgi:ABC-type Fe3+-hydroxamate transport system substrate-binding protein
MLRYLSKLFQPREALWLAPYLCIALIALGLLRPLPHFPVPAHSRTVKGSDGVSVQVAQPLRGIAFAPPSVPDAYLEDTHSPELLVYVGVASGRKWFANGMMSWVYPEVLKNDSLWNAKLFRSTSNPFAEIETPLAYDPSVYLGCGSPVIQMRSVGLPVLTSGSTCGGHQKLLMCPGSPVPPVWFHYPEGPLFIPLRVDADLIGHPELADPKISSYCESLDELQGELQPSTLAIRPRVLMVGEYKGDFPRAGVIDVTAERKIPGDDAERVLIMDPDMIFINGFNASPREFMDDPRRQGLKAVRDRRVYKWAHGGIAYKPAGIRWLAEIAHPERLQPKVRQLLRDRVVSEFGYRLSEEQIDLLLHVNENSSSMGTERFTRYDQTTSEQGSSK